MRPSGRKLSEMRPISIETGVMKHAEGSCLIKVGETHVLCSATIEDKAPPFLKNTGLGWVTAEYGMLPRATNSRNRREAASGKQTGRTQEIQRLIGRALRAGVDRSALGERQIVIDCDVLQADGGTRCAAITGGWVALRLAVNRLLKIGAVVTVSVRRVKLAMSEACANQREFITAFHNLNAAARPDGTSNLSPTVPPAVRVCRSASSVTPRRPSAARSESAGNYQL